MELPGINQVSPEIRQMALFDRAASAEYLGALVVLDTTGQIVADSTSIVPHAYNLGDRDYFRIHAERTDAALFISRPIRSRLRGDMMMVMSRRISAADGRFTGVVMGSMRLAYFQDLFGKLELGSKGSVTLFRTDGRLIMRRPFHEADIDRDLADSETFRSYNAMTSGRVVATGAVDGVERLFTFRHIGALPLVLSIGVAVDDISAAWLHKAMAIGLALAALCAATVVLCLLACKEILRRTVAETSLVEAAERLSVMAATDELTGLGNRRSFEEALTGEWRRAVRGETSIALLMLDADCFKLYNDQYGHPEGDSVLKSIASCIRQNVRCSTDMGARYGGEEFAVLLPETDIASALLVAGRICADVAGLEIPHTGSPCAYVTVSIGVAVAHPALGDDAAWLVKQADEVLYEAKRNGRNRVVSAVPASHLLPNKSNHAVVPASGLPGDLCVWKCREDSDRLLMVELDRLT
jgi:diguanylate cyclase (GGDEF)-like protein